ncbi:MAG: FitA-like ribbon-helix-helix domain-containing protein [bacterium]
MPTIVVRDVPKALHQQIKQSAVEHHRSASKEALAILEEGLNRPRLPRWDLLQDLPKIKGKPLDPVKIVRDARDGR